MNSNMTIVCETCANEIDCRIGYSNREIQPLTFSCLHCGAQIGITLDISEAPQTRWSFDGCAPSDNQPHGPFRGQNPFIDLHLDFPVRFGEYEMGKTPYMMAMHDLHCAAQGDHEKAHEMMQFYSLKLNALNELSRQSETIKRVINLYYGNNKQLFQKRACEFLEQDEERLLRPEDVNATLYCVIAKAFFPFTVFEEGREISERMPSFLYELNREGLGSFIDEIYDSSFLPTLQKDCLRLYPRIYDAELPLRPALFIDLTENTASDKVATRVSSQDFSGLKDLYKDVVEILGRQLVLVAGLNNLYHRGDSDKFKPIDGGTLSNLKKYAEKRLSDKPKYLDECWFNVSREVFNFDLRNAIAHNNVHYDGVEQRVTYYPGGGGLEESEEKTISFLEFMRLVLVSFREMHNLNHVIKSLIYYRHLIHDRANSGH